MPCPLADAGGLFGLVGLATLPSVSKTERIFVHRIRPRRARRPSFEPVSITLVRRLLTPPLPEGRLREVVSEVTVRRRTELLDVFVV